MLKRLCLPVCLSLISTIVVADKFGVNEVCYTPIRGTATTTNVNPAEQIGEFRMVLKRSSGSRNSPRFLRLAGELRGEIVGTDSWGLPVLNHVLRAGTDLIFTSNDTLNEPPQPTNDPCYLSVQETLRIPQQATLKGTGHFEDLSRGEIVVEGEIFNALSCPELLVGSDNEFEVLRGIGELCFEIN